MTARDHTRNYTILTDAIGLFRGPSYDIVLQHKK
jgi:hypothetical protein